MRVLIVSQYFWPESFRINEVAISLREQGCTVEVLTGVPNYPDGTYFQGYSSLVPRFERHEGIDVHRLPLIPRRSGRALDLALNYLSFVVSGILWGPRRLKGRGFDVVFVYAISPITQALPAILLGRLKGAPVVVWVQDLWPESLEATGFVRRRGLLNLVAALVRWIYGHCDLLLVQSAGFLVPVRAMAGATPVLVHPNPGEIGFAASPAICSGSAGELGPGFNIVFAGNIGTVQAIATIVEAAEQLGDIPTLSIVFVGSGSRSEWLADEVAKRKLTNVRILGRRPAETMPALLAEASALLVTLAKNPNLALTVPSKIQAYLAAGKPIIAGLDGVGADIVAASGAGVTAPSEDAGALARAIRTLYAASSIEREQMGLSGRRYYEDHYEPGMLAARLKQLLADTVRDRA